MYFDPFIALCPPIGIIDGSSWLTLGPTISLVRAMLLRLMLLVVQPACGGAAATAAAILMVVPLRFANKTV